MKYTIREVKEVEEREPEMELYLDQQRDGSVDLMGRDSTGEWYILRLRTDGTLYRARDIMPNSGIQVDEAGRIIEHSSSKDNEHSFSKDK